MDFFLSGHLMIFFRNVGDYFDVCKNQEFFHNIPAFFDLKNN